MEYDPLQLHPLQDFQKEAELLEALRAEMEAADAPLEQYQRLGIRESTKLLQMREQERI